MSIPYHKPIDPCYYEGSTAGGETETMNDDWEGLGGWFGGFQETECGLHMVVQEDWRQWGGPGFEEFLFTDFQRHLQQPGKNIVSDLNIGFSNEGKCTGVTCLEALYMAKFLVALNIERGS